MNNESSSVSCEDCGKEYAHFGYDDATGKYQMKILGEDLQLKYLSDNPKTTALVCTCGHETTISTELAHELQRF